MVEQQVVFDITNELGDFPRERAIGYADAGNGFDGLNGHDRSFLLVASFCGATPLSTGVVPAAFPTNCDTMSPWLKPARGRGRVIVVFDDVTMLDVAGAGEVFAEANRFGADYRLTIASVDGRDVTTSIGTRLGVTDAIVSIESADTVIVAGSDNLPRRAIDPELVEAVKLIAGRTRRRALICTGSFVLAQAGLLNGRRATTHWHDVGLFARAFPDITVEPDAIFICDGDVFTSAGVSSGIDLGAGVRRNGSRHRAGPFGGPMAGRLSQASGWPIAILGADRDCLPAAVPITHGH